MIEVANLEVRSFDLDHLDIFWELISADEDVSRYAFYVLRSVDGPAGPFQRITGPLRNTYSIRDPDVGLLHKWRLYYYMVRVEEVETGEYREFGPEWLRSEPDRIALEIQRREQKLFQQYNGRPAILLPALTFGQRCRHCFDIGPRGNTTGRANQQNCATCFDMGYVGGYASPIRIYINIDPFAKSIQKSDTSERMMSNTTARLSAFPPVKPKDMIVEAENVRWEVEHMTPTEKFRATVRQELNLHQIPKGDVRYKVPVSLDYSTEFTPDYDIHRPMSINPQAASPTPNLLGEL